jgi:hypothetical protein
MKREQATEFFYIFKVGARVFTAEFVHPASEGPPGQVVNENKWVLCERVFHRHRQGRPIKRKRQRPRYKRLAVCDSLDECETRVTQEAPL